MSRALIEDIFNDSEEAQEVTFPATDKELLILTDKFLGFEIPPKIFLQAMSIAAYDCESAFRYVDNYLAILKNNKRKLKKLLAFRPAVNFENN
ncbi:MAG: hypothetical protein RMX96_30470 [Nostoc sp. ChiSLP02]|nr:hypothetical protein [Nostoc sp. DedSLP05]MDZ8099029.1 hypothetical protein [Nostoc sp. DedSLP01]MDZ8189154.1 hypothetical protein [Nostoc sp. ChiSLP02]